MKKEEKDKLMKEYGIYHFRVPTLFERENAMGLFGETSTFYKIISHHYKWFYTPIPAPGQNDWLMNHKEYGQTFLEYTKFGYSLVPPNKNVIYIAPLTFNINDSLDENFITALILICQSYFHDIKVKRLDMSIDLESVEYREFEGGKYQLNANTIIEKIFNQAPNDCFCLISITDIDLYNDERVIKPRSYIYVPDPYKNDFCYELNSFKHKVGLISIYRFDPLYIIEDAPENENVKIQMYFILLKRVAKTVLKNVAHMFGLKNCIYFKCLMNGFGNMSEFDKRPFEVCPVCLRKLFTNISRAGERLEEGRVKNYHIILDRFKIIKECLEENFPGLFDTEVDWYRKRIKDINEELFGKSTEGEKEKVDT